MYSKSRIATRTTVALCLYSGLGRLVTREISIFRPRIFLCGDSLSLEQTRRRDQWPDMEKQQVSQFGLLCVGKSAELCAQERAAKEE